MANIERTIDIIFGGKDDLSKKLRGINKSLSGFETAVQGVAGPLAKVGNTILGVEAAALGMATAFGTYAVVKSKEFERTQIDLAKILGEEEYLLGAVTDQIEDMALKYGVGVNEIMRSTHRVQKSRVRRYGSRRSYSQLPQFSESRKCRSCNGHRNLNSHSQRVQGSGK